MHFDPTIPLPLQPMVPQVYSGMGGREVGLQKSSLNDERVGRSFRRVSGRFGLAVGFVMVLV